VRKRNITRRRREGTKKEKNIKMKKTQYKMMRMKGNKKRWKQTQTLYRWKHVDQNLYYY
jgi:hypothetical protein